MKLRKVVFWIHLSIGCTAGLIIFAMCVTGVVLAFERQMVNAAEASARRVTVPANTARQPLGAVIAKMSAGEGKPLTSVVIRPGADSAIELAFGREYSVYVDPYTGEKTATGANGLRTFFRTTEKWHRALGGAMDPKGIGRSLTGAGNLLFFFMGLSGMYLWWPRAWTPARLASTLRFERGARGKARDWNWHHVFGIWMVVPLLFITSSGVVMSYAWANNLLYRATGNQPPAPSRPAQPANKPADGSTPSQSVNGKSLDELLAVVSAGSADWKTISFRPGPGPVTFTVDRGTGGRPALRSQIVVDNTTGAITRVSDFANNNLGQKLRSWARFTHTGEQFGIVGQVIAMFASLAGALLVYTGLSLALRRFVASVQK